MSSTRKEVMKVLAREEWRELDNESLVHEPTGVVIGMVNNIHGRGSENIITEARRMARNAKTHNVGFTAWLMAKQGIEPGQTGERELILRDEVLAYLKDHAIKPDDLPQLISSISQFVRVNGYVRVLKKGASGRGQTKPSLYELTAPVVTLIRDGAPANGNGQAAAPEATAEKTIRAKDVTAGMVVGKIGKPPFRVTQVRETDTGFKSISGTYVAGVDGPAFITVPPQETLARHPDAPATPAIGTAVPDQAALDAPDLEVGQQNSDGRLVPDIHKPTRDQIDVSHIGLKIVARSMIEEARASVALDGETQSAETQSAEAPRRPDDVITGRAGAEVEIRPPAAELLEDLEQRATEPRPAPEPKADPSLLLPPELAAQLRAYFGAEDRARADLVHAHLQDIEATAEHMRRALAMAAEFEVELTAKMGQLKGLFDEQ